jgi:hypothetical protein
MCKKMLNILNLLFQKSTFENTAIFFLLYFWNVCWVEIGMGLKKDLLISGSYSLT